MDQRVCLGTTCSPVPPVPTKHRTINCSNARTYVVLLQIGTWSGLGGSCILGGSLFWSYTIYSPLHEHHHRHPNNLNSCFIVLTRHPSRLQKLHQAKTNPEQLNRKPQKLECINILRLPDPTLSSTPGSLDFGEPWQQPGLSMSGLRV